MHKLLFSSALAIACVLNGAMALSADRIGLATAVVNTVEGAVAGQPRKISVQDDVFFDERVTTGSDSASEFTFKDDTVLQLGPDSDLTLDAFVYEPNAQGTAQKMALTLGAGTFRFVSGHMDKTAYEINGPFGQIGVRGTSLIIDIDLNQVAEIYVEDGQIVVLDKDGKLNSYPAGTLLRTDRKGIASMFVNTFALPIRTKAARLDTMMLGASRAISHRMTALAAKASMSHDVYEEGCH